MKNGVMTYPMLGTIDGKLGYHMLLAPPFILSEEEADELVDKVVMTIKETFRGIG